MTNEEAILHMTLRREELKHSVSSDLDEDIKAFDMAIKALEQTKWISVSERLPESLIVKTLVSCEDVDGLPISTIVATYDAFSKTWNCEDKVIAWMPLPDPYKAESKDNE